ncbi:MAG: single-stranded DNA-binding protein [Clostridia bacterium]|nr:single-stranded DNA-binding protein [Clostridia bacterium]
MASFNKVFLMGNLCADPELKQTPTGVTVCTFRLAVQRKQKDGDGKSVSDFINIVAWRQTAEFVCKYFKKGASIIVEGSLQVREYNDAQGQRRYATEVVAWEVQFGASKGSSGQSSAAPAGQNGGGAAPAGQNGGGAAPAGQNGGGAAQDPVIPPPVQPRFEEMGAEDDLPF